MLQVSDLVEGLVLNFCSLLLHSPVFSHILATTTGVISLCFLQPIIEFSKWIFFNHYTANSEIVHLTLCAGALLQHTHNALNKKSKYHDYYILFLPRFIYLLQICRSSSCQVLIGCTSVTRGLFWGDFLCIVSNSVTTS